MSSDAPGVSWISVFGSAIANAALGEPPELGSIAMSDVISTVPLPVFLIVMVCVVGGWFRSTAPKSTVAGNSTSAAVEIRAGRGLVLSSEWLSVVPRWGFDARETQHRRREIDRSDEPIAPAADNII